MIIARVTRESSQQSRENDFLIVPISRRVRTQKGYMTHCWKARVTFFRLSHNLLESIKYRSSYTISKIVKIAENRQKTYFRVHLTRRVPNENHF